MSEDTRSQFEAAGQGQVFRYFDDLNPDEQASLLKQAAGIDLTEVASLLKTHVLGGDSGAEDYGNAIPADYTPLLENGGDPAAWKQAREVGEEALRAGRVAAFVVAGGQGTRLGFDGPKGTFPVTPVAGKSLFQVFAEKIRAASTRYGREIPWFIMTSEVNHADTVAYFQKNDFFGLSEDSVRFFSQGLMPAVDAEGKIMLESKGQIALSPDGHGGSLRALVRSGCVDLMKERGIDLLSYFQVDNPLVSPVEPEFVGFHLLGESELSSRACVKAYAGEKVGVFVTRDGKTQVLEYSDLPPEMVEATDESGALRFRAGSIAVHLFSRDLVERMGAGETSLPFHKANKKVPSVEQPAPTKPNGIKFEMFVFDALPFAKNPVIVELSRADGFSPVKNAEGVDSPESSKADQLRQFARWVKAAGQDLAVDETGLPEIEFEISPLFADSLEAYLAKEPKPEISAGCVIT